jgi:hypothetical protein
MERGKVSGTQETRVGCMRKMMRSFPTEYIFNLDITFLLSNPRNSVEVHAA